MLHGLVLVGIVLGIFIILVLLRVPVGFAMLAAGFVYVLNAGIQPGNIVVRMANSIDNVVYLALPFYLIAAELMNRSGITERLLNATQSLFGQVRGGLAQTNIVASLIFSGMSGAALADCAGLGKLLIPAMKKRGYSGAFSASITAVSSTVGPIFPPSIPMVIFGALTGTSVGALFIAGVVPGVMMSVFLMVLTAVTVARRGYEARRRFNWKTILISIRKGFLPLLSPVIILCGIFFGWTSPTEAGAVAILYAMILGVFVYRTLKLPDILDGFARAMHTTVITLILIAFSSGLGWMIILETVAHKLALLLGPYASSFLVIMGVTNIALLLAGMFMDPISAMLVFVPVFLPLAQGLGMSTIQFGAVVVINLMIGMSTPPVGLSLYVTADIAEVNLKDVIVETLPYYIPLLATLIVTIVFAAVTTWLPSMMFG
jgi:tripartite ATP-independent transporter DctM subunit